MMMMTTTKAEFNLSSISYIHTERKIEAYNVNAVIVHIYTEKSLLAELGIIKVQVSTKLRKT